MKYTEAEIADLKERPENGCDVWARSWVKLRKGGRLGLVGPCPVHSQKRDAADSTAFECDAQGWVCAHCEDGGDVVKLIQLAEGLSFLDALDRMGGSPSPDRAGGKTSSPSALRAPAEDNNEYRMKERRRARALLGYGRPIAGTPVERYLRDCRGVDFPPDVRLRFDPAARYYVPGDDGPRLIHTGPAMLAVIQRLIDPSSSAVRDGSKNAAFYGAHTTWIDLAQRKGKAVVHHPDTGEELPAKKMRGSKKGGAIQLVDVASPKVLVLGEGIEKVLAVWTALHRAQGRSPSEAQSRDLSGWAFWSAGDLGNLGGKAAATVAHPALKGPRGRPRRCGGPLPDFSAPAIVIPDSVERLILLGDSTSDRFEVECALRRASVRYQRSEGIARAVVVAWAPAGMDFDELRPGD